MISKSLKISSSFMKILFIFICFTNLIYANNTPLKKIKLQLQWKYQFQFAGFIMAKELGYYKDKGLDVTIIEYNNTNSIKDLEDGKIDYAINNSLLAYHDKRLNSVTLLATYFQRSPLVIIAQPEIKSALDLKHKKIMISQNNLYNSSLSILFEYFNINETNTKFVNPSFDLKDFVNKEVDAFTGFRSNEVFELRQKKVPFNLIDPIEYGFSTNAINLFASHQKVTNNPKQINDFLEATKKGWIYSLDHIDEVAKIIHEKYRPSVSLENLVYEGKITKEMMLPDLYDIGEINRDFVLKTFHQLQKSNKIALNETTEKIMLHENNHKDISELFVSLIKKILHIIDFTTAISVLVFVLVLIRIRKYWIERLQVEIDKQNLIQERFSFALEGSNDGLWDWNLLTNEVYYSPRWKQIIGYSEFEIENSLSSWERLIHPDDLVSSMEVINELLISNDKNQKFNLKFRMLHKNGYYVPILSRAKKIYNEQNKLIRFVGTHVDLSQIVAMEDAYRRERDRSQLYLDTAEVLLVALDINGNVTMLNRKGEELLGYKEDEILGKSWFELGLLPNDTEEKIRHFFEKLITLTEISHESIEHAIINKKGKEIILSFRNALLFDDNKKVIGILSSGVDITKQISTERELQKQNEQLYRSEKMIAMGEMIGNIAHQWRQPLSVISSLASAISFKKEYGKLNDVDIIPYMEQIVDQTNYLSKTIDDFRNFIKGDTSKDLVNITSLCDKTLSITTPSLHNNYIKVITNIDPNATIIAHENELMQALINIINNAKDALIVNDTIDERYIFIEAKMVNEKCEIKIKDNGGGIKPASLGRIFEPYYTTKHQSQGTGLGLSMTHKIITELHNGTLAASNVTFTYQNEDFTGACFTIVL